MQPLLLPTHTHHCRPGDTALTPVEQHLLDVLGAPWMGPDPAGVDLARAQEHVAYLHAALDHGGLGDRNWMTTKNAKQEATVLNAGVAVAAGVTMLSARSGASAWKDCDAILQGDLAAALDMDFDTVERLLRMTVCPHATPACIGGCVMHQGQSKCATNEEMQLGRTLLMLAHPAEYLAITHHHLQRLVRLHGADRVLWRTNMADDVRWEMVAPGLFDGRLPAIAYTKFAPCCRPERPDLNFRVAYSRSEKWTNEDLRAVCAAGHNAAVVFDVTKGALPETLLGIPVVDGDTHDHHHLRPHGVIIGLSAKGNAKEVRVALRRSGFSVQPAAA